MGYLKICCDNCGGKWDVYHRDINQESANCCPHCFERITPYTWKQIQLGFGEMCDAELELAKDHANHSPLFTVDFVSDSMFVNHKNRKGSNAIK